MEDVKSEIAAQIGKMNALMCAGKIDELLGFYTDDCRILPPSAPMVSGKEGVKGFLSTMAPFMEKIGKSDNTIIEVVLMGEHAFLVTVDIAYDKKENIMSNNKGITLWKKVDGNWQLKWTSFSSDKPTPTP